MKVYPFLHMGRVDMHPFTVSALFISCLLAFTHTPMDAAEIPADEDAKTRRDYTRARYDYFMRDLERFDDAVGAKTTGVARNFVEKATRYKVVSQQQEYVDMLLRECKRALEAAPDHAIVQLRAAHLYNATGRAAEAVALLQSVAEQLQQPQFQSLYRARMECGQLMWWIETKIGTPANGDSWQQRYIDLLVEYGELDNELADQRFLHTEFNWTYGVMGTGPRETLATRVWDSKANPWLRHTLMGQFRVDNAWNQRGSGFAHTVTDEGWAAFRENMEEAAQHFTTAWEMDPQNPVASAEMIMVAENDYGDVSTREWFDRSVAAQMDFPKAYWQYLYTLRPRWGGSWEEMVAFGEECLATERFDTAVPLVYIDAVCGVAQEQENWEQTLNDDDIFDRFVEILDQAAAAPERAEPLHGGYRGNQLTSAIYDLAADWNKKELRDDVQADLVDSYDSTYGQYIGLTYRTDRDIDAATAMPDHIRQKLSAWRPKTGDGRETTRKKLRRIAALFAEQSESTTDPRQARLLAEMAMQNDRQFRFGDGEWVPLDFDLSYHSWIEHGGSWKVIDSAQIEGRLPPASTGMRLWNAGSYPGPMELEVEMTPLDSYGPSARPGLLIGYLGHIKPNPNGRVEEPGGRCFWLDPETPAVGVGFTFDAKTKSHSIEPAESYRIRVKAWNGYYVVLVNDRYLFSQQSPTFKPDGYVGIGSMSYSRSSHETRFSNMQVRKLPYGRPPSNDDWQQTVAYFDEVLEFDAEDPWAHVQRGMAYIAGNQFEAAINDLQKMSDELTDPQQLNLAEAYIKAGQPESALKLLDDPDSLTKEPKRANLLAWLLATSPRADLRNPEKAVKLAQRACQARDFTDPVALETLAASYAALGKFDKAIRWQQQAIEWTNDPDAVEQRKERLELFESGKPVQDSPPSEAIKS